MTLIVTWTVVCTKLLALANCRLTNTLKFVSYHKFTFTHVDSELHNRRNESITIDEVAVRRKEHLHSISALTVSQMPHLLQLHRAFNSPPPMQAGIQNIKISQV